LVVAAILLVRYRVRLNAWVYGSQKSILGQKVADASAGRQKPVMIGVVGCFAGLMGLTMTFFAVVGIFQNWL